MCTDFTNLNKECPKDFYPLPCLGRLVDGSPGHEIFDFMDASKGYHHIRMLLADEEKTAFITEYGLYCWKGKSVESEPREMFVRRGVRKILRVHDKRKGY
ncbi:hypothetical protein LIER_17683 [Lithospermum erythrorhizon]|uniref:Uncharacterized protein n=1 Tax=Lithospermum erythrorhizon TaxID=34254 RepID=A0AAV3QB65_LITER